MDEVERKIRLRLKNDFIHYAAKCLKIRTENEGIKPFILNQAQQYLHKKVEEQKKITGKVRVIIVKGRQLGCSTYTEARYFWIVTHYKGYRAFILTHDAEAASNLFDMAKTYYEFCPNSVKPRVEKSNAKELIFSSIKSGYKLGTAGNKGVGRSSTIQLFHGSEVSRWPNASDHAKGIMNAVPNTSGTEIFLESTAKGQGNYFHQQWQMAESGESEYMPIFIPWYWKSELYTNPPDDFELIDDEIELKYQYNLTDSQIYWRRLKIKNLTVSGADGLREFKQEYPMTAAEAFEVTGEDTFILPELVNRARKHKEIDRVGHLLIGVDPARFGDDRTSIIRRKGREAYGLRSYVKKNTMEVVGLVHRIIIDESPTKVFIDIGGLGAGIVDRLIELGYRDIVVGINSGESPLDEKRYLNKRAEIWGEMREWLANYPCKIPDQDSLHSDLTNIKYTYNSHSRLQLESSEKIKKRGIRSPDEATALALTFALPQSAIIETKRRSSNEAGRAIWNSMQNLDSLKKKSYSS